jgi:hypothetical protein
MATFTWNAPTSGNWNVGTDWTLTGGTGTPPPGSVTPDTDVAVLSGASSPYTVTISAGNSFDIAALDIAGQSAVDTTTLSIFGSLLTDSLVYSGPGDDALIDVEAGGLLQIRTTLSAADPETITNTGGTIVLGSATSQGIGINSPNVTFSFDGTGGGVMEYDGVFLPSRTASQVITEATAGDEFVFNGADFRGDTFIYSGTTLVVKFGGATILTMSNLSGVTPLTSASFELGSNVDTIQIVCYAAGTRIRTPSGERGVESLVPGDVVLTLADGQTSPQRVKWIGRRRIDLRAHPRPETVAPVRIEQDALAEKVPHTDLLLSPDHAVFVDGKLICARQLINSATIRQEKDLPSIEYFHVELDSHAILFAEGLPVESYLNTGNRGFFANSDEPLVLHPDLGNGSDYPTREAGSCAPFVWDEARVRPVWQRLADRAAAIGRPVPQRVTTADANLRVLVKGPERRNGKPIHSDGNLVLFLLPPGVGEVRLASRAQLATEARPWLEDRRRLGVRVKRIVLRGANELREIPMDHPDLTEGWWAVERDGQMMSRWTDGNAVLPLPAMAGDIILEIHLGDAMSYVVEAEVPDTERAAA